MLAKIKNFLSECIRIASKITGVSHRESTPIAAPRVKIHMYFGDEEIK
jgi:hypothetical protein